MTALRPVPDLPRTHIQIETDEGALRDAIEAFECWPSDDDDYRKEIEEQIASIRRRLPDHGASVDEEIERTVRFGRGRTRPTDPPGTIRLRRVGGPVREEFPRGPLNGGAAAALAAVALALAGVA